MALFSVGHSNHPAPEFVGLLQAHSIAVLVDVRSKPFSRWHPQYNRDRLRATLDAAGIAYDWRGEHLGGLGNTSTDSPAFVAAMDELSKMATNRNVAMMCSERDPQACHRSSKLGAWLARERGLSVTHITAAGLLTQSQVVVESPRPRQDDLAF